MISGIGLVGGLVEEGEGSGAERIGRIYRSSGPGRVRGRAGRGLSRRLGLPRFGLLGHSGILRGR